MRKSILAAAIISIVSSPVHAEVYKCANETGTFSYQQSPCVQGSDTGKTTIRTQPNASYNPNDELDKINKAVSKFSKKRRLSEIDSEIGNARNNITSYQNTMDYEMAQLRRSKIYSENNRLSGNSR